MLAPVLVADVGTISCSLDPHVFHGLALFPYVFHCFSIDFPIVVPHVFPMFFHVFSMFSLGFPYVFPMFSSTFRAFHGLPGGVPERWNPGLAPQQRGAAAFDAGQMPGLGESVAGQPGIPGSMDGSWWWYMDIYGRFGDNFWDDYCDVWDDYFHPWITYRMNLGWY